MKYKIKKEDILQELELREKEEREKELKKLRTLSEDELRKLLDKTV